MLNKKEFEMIIKENLEKYSPGSQFGYKIPADNDPNAEDVPNEKRCYKSYYTNKAFDDFITEMQLPQYRHHYDRYISGKGSELKMSRGRYGFTPPKMASVASSSRFCYLSLRNGGKAIGANGPVLFEVGCKIEGVNRIPPQLDAWFPEDRIYVEAKCQEIFTGHQPILKAEYWDKIYGKNNSFGFSEKEKCTDPEFLIPLSAFDIQDNSSMFDIKQFLCHLMGIASEKESNETPVTLMYLFFIPKTDCTETNGKLQIVFEKLQAEIAAIFNSDPIQTFIKKHHITLAAVAEHDYIMKDLTTQNKVILYP